MLPAVSGILPDNFADSRVALLAVSRPFAICTRAPGNMPAAASRMLALPCVCERNFC